MRPGTFILALLTVLLSLSPALGESKSFGQLYVAVSPEEAGPSAIVAFDVDGRGRLEQVATYETGGAGDAGLVNDALIVDSSRRLLFVTNPASDSISVFRIEPDGGLSPVAGSPFPTSPLPAFMALHPNGEFLFVVNSGTIQTYEIGGEGQLVPSSSVGVGSFRELQVDDRGRSLFAADMSAGLRAYSISAFGDLTEFVGSPFPLSDPPWLGRPYYLQIVQRRRILVQDLDEGIGVWDIKKGARVDLVPGSPFPIGEFASPMAVTDDGAYAYVGVWSEPYTYGFRIEDDGRITPLDGSPFEGGYGIVALITPKQSSRLYEVARFGPEINLFEVQPDGALVETATFPISDSAARVPNGAVYSPSPRWDGLHLRTGAELGSGAGPR